MINAKKVCMVFFEVTFVFLLLQQNIFPSELTFVSLLMTILSGCVLIFFTDRKIYYNPYIISYGAFIILAIAMTLVGHGTGDNNARIIMFIMQCVSSLCLFNYLMRVDNPERFIKIFIVVSVISLVIIFGLVGDNVFTSRLGHNGSGAIVSYYIAGTPIYKSSNGTANFCAIALLFLLYYAEKLKKWYCYIPIIFFAIGILLCGSRKGLLFAIIYILYIYFFMNKGVTVKKLLLFFGIPVLGYVLLMKVPVVYEVVGIRVQSLIMNLFNESNILDGNSYAMRNQLKEIAYKWIGERPILGYGLGTFQAENEFGAENNLLQLMVEFGIIGTIVYYSFLIPLGQTLLKHRKGTTLIGVFCILIITILMQDYGGVTYSWQHITLWYSVFWAISYRELQRGKCIKIKV